MRVRNRVRAANGNNVAANNPSLFRQWVAILSERYKTQRALRLLSRQEWSVDFLAALLIKAARLHGSPLEMTIQNGSTVIQLNTAENVTSIFKDDSIFDHLDNDMMVNSFIRSVNAHH